MSEKKLCKKGREVLQKCNFPVFCNQTMFLLGVLDYIIIPVIDFAFVYAIFYADAGLFYGVRRARYKRMPWIQLFMFINKSVCTCFRKPFKVFDFFAVKFYAFFLEFKAVFVLCAAACIYVQEIACNFCEKNFFVPQISVNYFTEAAAATAVTKRFPFGICHILQFFGFPELSFFFCVIFFHNVYFTTKGALEKYCFCMTLIFDSCKESAVQFLCFQYIDKCIFVANFESFYKFSKFIC